MNKAKYKISCIVWYLGKTGNGYGLRSSAVVSWTASNPNGERLIYRYQLADGSSKLESELAPTALIAVSRLLDPVKKNYFFSNPADPVFDLSPETVIEYLTHTKRHYYIRENFSGISFSDIDGNLNIIFSTTKYFEKCDFSNIIIDIIGRNIARPQIIFISCKFTSASAILDLAGNSIFDGSDFSRGNFSNCNLDGASLNDCNFELSAFLDVSMKYCSILGSNFNDSNFSGADFKGTRFARSSFRSTNFTNAGLNNSDLSCCNLEEVFLTNASLRNSLLYSANLSDAKMENADFTGAKGITNEQLYAFANKDIDEYTFTGVDGETITVP